MSRRTPDPDPPSNGMSRCLVEGCRVYDRWLPANPRHYLTDHYEPDPSKPQPRGTHPKKANL